MVVKTERQIKKAINDFGKEKDPQKYNDGKKSEVRSPLGKRRVSRPRKSKKSEIDMKDKIKRRVIIELIKHPKIQEQLSKSAEINFRTIEQQALYYIWTALNIEKNEKK